MQKRIGGGGEGEDGRVPGRGLRRSQETPAMEWSHRAEKGTGRKDSGQQSIGACH